MIDPFDLKFCMQCLWLRHHHCLWGLLHMQKKYDQQWPISIEQLLDRNVLTSQTLVGLLDKWPQRQEVLWCNDTDTSNSYNSFIHDWPPQLEQLCTSEVIFSTRSLLLHQIDRKTILCNHIYKCYHSIVSSFTGVDLITACDIRLCTQDAWFQVKVWIFLLDRRCDFNWSFNAILE